MKVGDPVYVTVLGKRVAARVVNVCTALGNVEVELDLHVRDERLASGSIVRLVRAPSDVEPALPARGRRCDECREPWVDLVNGQCRRCGNRTWEDRTDEPVPVVADPAYRDALLGGHRPDPTRIVREWEEPAADEPSKRLGAFGELVLDPSNLDKARAATKAFGIPDHVVGIPTPWWRQWWQRHVSRRP